MHYKVTTVGFYDMMGPEQVDYILNQTEMPTVVCSLDYAQKLIKMKRENMATMLRNLIVVDPFEQDLKQSAEEAGLSVHSW